MTSTFDTGSEDKTNVAYFPHLHGMQLRNLQKRLVCALLRRPSLAPTVLRSGIRQTDLPEEWRNAFSVAVKEPGRGRQIAADPNGEPTIRHLYTHVVEFSHGQALRIAEQIVMSVRQRNDAQNDDEKEGEQDLQESLVLDPQLEVDQHGHIVQTGDQDKERANNGDDKEAEPTGVEHTLTEDATDLAEMNSKYAVVKIGGKTRVVSFEEDAAYPGCAVPVFSTIHDFCAFHAKRKKIIPGKRRKIGLGRWWIDHEQRRQYDGIVYAPGTHTPTGKLNLWNGFGCMSRKGKCELYLEHLLNNICAGNKEYFEYLLDWMAYALQYPDRPGEVAVVLRGKEGTGKGIAAKQFGRLLGAHFRHIVHAKHLTGHFNAHLQQCSVLFADEAFFAGDRSHESILKALITEETLLIEPKGIDPFPVRNCVHLMMSSNSDWVVPAGAEARRYFVLNVGDARIQDHEYFVAITTEMDNGGREALLDCLQIRDLSTFNVRLVPQTRALAEQKAHSRRGMDRLVETIAHDGMLPSTHIDHPDVAITSGEDKGEGFYCAARSLVPELKHASSIVISNALRNDWECLPWKGRYQRGIRFPSLPRLRELFDKRHGKQDWPATETETLTWSTAQAT